MLEPKSHARLSPSAQLPFQAARRTPARTTCGCNPTGKCNECGRKDLSLQRSAGITSRSTDRRDAVRERQGGHDFSNLRILSRVPSPVVQDQTPAQSGDPGVTQGTSPALAGTETNPTGAEAAPRPGITPVIDSVEMVTSPGGAVGGYREREVMCDASLNTPGPFNDFWAKGSIANIFQVHFHVSQGSPTDVRAARVVNGTATAQTGAQTWTKSSEHDGPPPWEYQFTKDKMVIADAPGWCNEMLEKDFPVTYSRDFGLWAFDPLTNKILASIAYHVEISKTYYGQIDAVNTLTVTDTRIGGAVAAPGQQKK